MVDGPVPPLLVLSFCTVFLSDANVVALGHTPTPLHAARSEEPAHIGSESILGAMPACHD